MITATAAVIGALIGVCLLGLGAAIVQRLEAQKKTLEASLELLKVAVGQGLLTKPAGKTSVQDRYVPSVDVFCTQDGGVAIRLGDDAARLYTHLSPDKADELAGLIHERATLQREPEGMAS